MTLDRREAAQLIAIMNHCAGILGALPLEELTIYLGSRHQALAVEESTPARDASMARYRALRLAAGHAGNLVEAVERAAAQWRASIAAAEAEAEGGGFAEMVSGPSNVFQLDSSRTSGLTPGGGCRGPA
jgi:hypothetical protein